MNKVQRRKDDLYSILIEITQKCNAKCDQCGSRCDINSEESLTSEEILRALTDIKENIGTDMMINISGGEPLLRSDWKFLLSKIAKLGFDWGMVTNGSLLDENTVAELMKCGMKTISISIDGVGEVHNKLRHLPGSYDKIIKGIKYLYKYKESGELDHLQVTYVANKKNIQDFEKLYDVLNELDIDSLRVSNIDCIGRAEDYRELLLDAEDIAYLTSKINELNKKNQLNIVWSCPHFLNNMLENRHFECHTGIHTMSILYNGDIFVCPNVPRLKKFIQGNIKRDSISKVWINGFQYFRNRSIPEYCKNCKYKRKCKGDSVHTWDYENDKPKFCYRDMFESKSYLEYVRKKFRDREVDIIGNGKAKVVIEPEAYKDIERYFHIGCKHPLSMYEQQMALIGFKEKGTYVVRFVAPCDSKLRYKDNAIFNEKVLIYAHKEVVIANRNIKDSDFNDEYSPQKLHLLGFIHSHPIQEELQYSIGDEKIHNILYKLLGDYIGILVNPSNDTIGCYYGKNIKQAKLIIIR